ARSKGDKWNVVQRTSSADGADCWSACSSVSSTSAISVAAELPVCAACRCRALRTSAKAASKYRWLISVQVVSVMRLHLQLDSARQMTVDVYSDTVRTWAQQTLQRVDQLSRISISRCQVVYAIYQKPDVRTGKPSAGDRQLVDRMTGGTRGDNRCQSNRAI